MSPYLIPTVRSIISRSLYLISYPGILSLSTVIDSDRLINLFKGRIRALGTII